MADINRSIRNLDAVIDAARDDLTAKNAVRDLTLARSRSLIRFCANSIRATHRHEYAEALALLEEAKAAAAVMCDEAAVFPDVYYAGYLQDAMKELAEAAITLALVTSDRVPTPEELAVDSATYLNGLAEAIGEMRRFALDSLRREDIAEAERLLQIMDDVYSQLVTIDFPDSLTRGLRRITDMVRGVTERTRGDLTLTVRQEQLRAELQAFQKRLSAE
jgi:translin